MERKLAFLLLISILLTSLGASSSLGGFSEIDLSGPSSMELKSDTVFYRNGGFIGEASPATGDGSHLVSFQENGEVNWEKNLSEREEKLEKAGKVLEGRHIGVLYNESLEVLNLQGEKIDEFQIDMRSKPGFSLYYVEAAYSDGNLYVGDTEPCCKRGFNFRIKKINQEGIIEWNRTVKAVRDRNGP